MIKNIATKLNDVKLFEINFHKDNRGSFTETFNKKIQSLIGDNICFVQDNESISRYGVLRGLHFQKEPHQQSKLVRVSFGEIQDVVVDIREGSQTYGKWESFNISSDNRRVLFVPKGFAHGFLVLSKFAIVNYKVDNYYNKESEYGINYNDNTLGIDWDIDKSKIIINSKDLNYQKFR